MLVFPFYNYDNTITTHLEYERFELVPFALVPISSVKSFYMGRKEEIPRCIWSFLLFNLDYLLCLDTQQIYRLNQWQIQHA